MKCWVCSRQARGCVNTDGRYGIGDSRRYPIDWVFCSRRCQNAFHKLYGSWKRAHEDGMPAEDAMVDMTPLEQEAMRSCLKSFGEVVSTIGFDKPLGAYSEAEALQVIDAIVTRYVDAMAEHHEHSKYPPVRMPGTKPISDPIRAADNPFSDMKDDLPWEEK